MKIGVFAGHGGSDPGATANGLREKDLNLEILLKLSERLRNLGYQVINNRTTDINRNINQDAALANNQGVNALIEIHLNSNMGRPGTGSEAFVSVRDTGRARAFASDILKLLNERLGYANRGVKTNTNLTGADTFGILRLTNMPAVLLEVAFLNNPQDMEKFDAALVARAIADAVLAHFPITVVPPVIPPPVEPPEVIVPNIIRHIQSTLNLRYGFNLALDGIAGPLTRRAIVRALQMELNLQFGRNLIVDGIFGPLTQAATVNVRPGARGNITYLIQAALFIRGYDYVLPDGIFGMLTERAVRAFQGAAGLQVDGIAGPLTQRVLFSW